MRHQTLKERVAIDLDETLGCPIIDVAGQISGFAWRPGCRQLLSRLSARYELVLWTVSPRRYANKALSFGMEGVFDEVLTWDELKSDPKDIRKANVAWLIDDSPHHQQAIQHSPVAHRYIVVPPIGSREDRQFPHRWRELIEAALL